jgi:AcrR family transcriptional regulator
MDEMRDRILTVGRALLVEQGLRSVTTRAIAEQARISKKTLYAYFASLDDLKEEVVVSFMESNLARWDEVLAGNGSSIDRALASLRFVGQFLPQIQSAVVSQVGAMPPSLWKRIDAIRTKRLARFRTLLEAGQREGYFRTDVDPGQWLLLLTNTVRHVLVPSVLIAEDITLPELVSTIQKIYFDGLLTEKGRRHVAERQVPL